jgi:hypothetical protein
MDAGNVGADMTKFIKIGDVGHVSPPETRRPTMNVGLGKRAQTFIRATHEQYGPLLTVSSIKKLQTVTVVAIITLAGWPILILFPMPEF